MDRYGRDVDAIAYWSDEARDYADALTNDYHQHRLEMIGRLIPGELAAAGRRIYDFGCGDAVMFARFLDAGARVEGHDVAPDMIALAAKNLSASGHDPSLARLGGADAMADLDDASFDAVLSFNVLAYLTDEEEAAFYAHAARVLRPGGHLIVTHSNELFDLFSLNRFTAEFIAEQLVSGDATAADIGALLARGDEPASRTTYNVRENPLAYRFKLAGHGFEEVQQEFGNLHPVPPLLQRGEKGYLSTVVPESDRWRLMFTCSTYGSRSVRRDAAGG